MMLSDIGAATSFKRDKATIPHSFATLVVCFLLLANSKLVHSTVEDEEAKLRQDQHLAINRAICLEHNSTNSSSTHHDNQVSQLKCPQTFDSILCWAETPANVIARQKCPEYVIGFINPNAYAERICMSDGKWQVKLNKNHQYVEYTNYIGCTQHPDAAILAYHLPIVKYISKIGSGVSLATLVLAILILSGLKRLHCARNILHINLFASFLFFSIMQLIKEFLWVSSLGFSKDVIPVNGGKYFIMNEEVSHWECKLFMSIYKYAESTEHAMIFSEALYLNTLVSFSTFNEKNHYKSYITLGWLAPLVWLVPYITVLAFYKHNSCWTEQTAISYIQVVPQCILILANFALFVNIVRILFIKLQSGQTDSRDYRYKKLAKSTLILLPLFGIYYIMFNVWQPFVREKLSVELELARLYFDIVCNSFQGLIISLIYVFFNSEVRNEIIKIIERVLLRRNPNMRRFSKFSTPPNRERSISLNDRNAVNRKSSSHSEKKAKKSLSSNRSSVPGKSNRNHLDSLKTQDASSMCVSEANSMIHFDEAKFKMDDEHKNGTKSGHLNSYDLSNKLLLEKSRKSSRKKFSFFSDLFRRFKAEKQQQRQAPTSENGSSQRAESQAILAPTRPTLRVDSIDVHEIKLKTKRNSKRVKLRAPSEPTDQDMAESAEPDCNREAADADKTDTHPVKIVVNGDLENRENESGNDSAFDESSNLLQNSDDVPNDEQNQEQTMFLKHLNLNMSSLDFIDETGKFGDKQESLKNPAHLNRPSQVNHVVKASDETRTSQDQSMPNGDLTV